MFEGIAGLLVIFFWVGMACLTLRAIRWCAETYYQSKHDREWAPIRARNYED